MDAAADSLLTDELLQQRDQLPAIGRAHPAHQILFVLAGDLTGTREQSPSLAGQEEGANSPIARLGAPLDQVPLLELVDERNHATGRGSDRLGDRLLGLAFGRVDHVQDPEQRWLQLDRPEPLCEPLGCVGSHLREEESHGRRRLVPALRVHFW